MIYAISNVKEKCFRLHYGHGQPMKNKNIFSS